MQDCAQAPEALTAGELPLALLAPALGIPPQLDWRLAVTEIHHTAWVEWTGRRRLDPQMLEQALVDAARFQPRHLGGPHIKDISTAAKGACTAPV